MTFVWTEDKVAELRKCIAEGLSSGLTEAHFLLTFGTHISRNAIIGKALRLGLKWRNAAYNRGGATVNKTLKAIQDRDRKPVRRTPFKGFLPTPEPFGLPETLPSPPNSQPIDLMGLTNWTCRWPITEEGPHWFCGALEADNVAGIVYCRWHARASVGPAYRKQQGTDA